MSRGVYLKDAQVLQQVYNALGTYVDTTNTNLDVVLQQASRFLEWVVSQVHSWHRHVEQCTQDLHVAEHKLEACLKSFSYGKRRPVCDCEAQAVQNARKALDNAKKQLKIAQDYQRRLEDAISRFKTHSSRFRAEIRESTNHGKQILSKKAGQIQAYAAAEVGPNYPVFINPRVMAPHSISYHLPAAPKMQLKTLRAHAVAQAWKLERKLVLRTNKGTRNWTKKQFKELLRTGKVHGFVGHHIRSVKGHGLKWASDPRNIVFLKPGASEHYLWHNKCTRNPTTGRLIDREALIRNYERHNSVRLAR